MIEGRGARSRYSRNTESSFKVFQEHRYQAEVGMNEGRGAHSKYSRNADVRPHDLFRADTRIDVKADFRLSKSYS